GTVGDADIEAHHLQDVASHHGQVLVILDQQDALGIAVAGFFGPAAACAVDRQVQRHGGAVPRRALHLYRTAGLAGESVDLAETEAGALAELLGGEEGFEDSRTELRRDAAAVVTQRNGDELAVQLVQFAVELVRVSTKVNAACLGNGVAGVDGQVEQAQLQQAGVDPYRRQVRCDIAGQLDVVVQALAQQLQGVLQGRAGLDQLRLQRLPPGEVEQPAGDAGATVDGRANGFQLTQQPRIGGLPGAQVGGAANDGQQVVEIVGQATGELAQRLELLCLHQLFARLVEALLGLAALGDVPGDLGQADQLALFVVHGVEHRQRPEATAVLAQSPALIQESAVAKRDRERPVGPSGGAILLGEEA